MLLKPATTERTAALVEAANMPAHTPPVKLVAIRPPTCSEDVGEETPHPTLLPTIVRGALVPVDVNENVFVVGKNCRRPCPAVCPVVWKSMMDEKPVALQRDRAAFEPDRNPLCTPAIVG